MCPLKMTLEPITPALPFELQALEERTRFVDFLAADDVRAAWIKPHAHVRAQRGEYRFSQPRAGFGNPFIDVAAGQEHAQAVEANTRNEPPSDIVADDPAGKHHQYGTTAGIPQYVF